jgi:vacuolar-type H+-ATPase subunit H
VAKLKRGEKDERFINEHRREIDDERIRIWRERQSYFQSTEEGEIFEAAVRIIKERYAPKKVSNGLHTQ